MKPTPRHRRQLRTEAGEGRVVSRNASEPSSAS